MQSDRNLVIYQSGVAKWASKTNGKGSGPYGFLVQNDGNAVIYGSTGAIWATNTAGKGYCQLCVYIHDDTNGGTNNDLKLTYFNTSNLAVQCTLTEL
jgi:hypothetical protein